MASEKLRQREVHKYYQAWLDSSIGFDATASNQLSRYHADGSQLRVSKDKALIAFAQLGCLRMNLKRSVVTLISSDQQYILAEATKTLSLVSGDGDAQVQDEIWFGNAMIPRSQGISGDALFPGNYTAIGPNNTSYTAQALVVNDLTLHEKYKSRAYVGKGVNFYCGVPISTESGIPIGVYTITDDKPRSGLTADELRFMHDMAATVMRHLDVVSNEAARFRGETMVVGLGRFISGASSLHDEIESTGLNTQRNAFSLSSPGARQFKGMTITAAKPSRIHAAESQVRFEEPASTDPPQNEIDGPNLGGIIEEKQNDSQGVSVEPKSPLHKSHSHENFGKSSEPTSENIFSRAARILKECVAADGVLFFDAVTTNFAKRTDFSTYSSTGHSDDVKHKSSHPSQEIPGDASLAAEPKDSTLSMYSGASEESDFGATYEAEKQMCRLLGHSLETCSLSPTGFNLLDKVQMTERSLNRLVKLYPQGKIFTFHSDTGSSTSDGENLTEDTGKEQSHEQSQDAKPIKLTTSDSSKRIPRAIASELERLVPHAQSIVWLPLWDFTKHRWSAGLFLWSRRPDRLVAAQDDLVYLKAFANSIMVEVARLDAARADTAKSTFIANISHELRTPLHGILGNLDILQDTKLSEFQQSLVTAIEVCGRTLSDTIDHVLDYSKINQLSKYSRKRNKSSSTALPMMSPASTANSNAASMIEADFDIATIVEEAVEAAYASHTFQSSGRIRLRSSSLTGSQRPETPTGNKSRAQNVHVIVDLEHRDSWWVRSQPSAIRRVVTNLFGNALKYTDSGTIQVSLCSPRLTRTVAARSSIPILLSVRDTGRGMSADFVRNHAFMPFSQESQFSTGTGLGLSIVQQIIKSLGGKIELKSKQGIGTEIKVYLNLHIGSRDELGAQSTLSVVTRPILERKPDIMVSILSAEDVCDPDPPPGLFSESMSLEQILKSWFGLYIITAESAKACQPDIVMYVTPPTIEQLQQISLFWKQPSNTRFIIVVLNTIEKASLSTKYFEIANQIGFQIDVLSYPIGPQKLGQALLRCLGITEATDKLEEPRPSDIKKSALSRSHSRNSSMPSTTSIGKARSSELDVYPQRGPQLTDETQSPSIASQLDEHMTALKRKREAEFESTVSQPTQEFVKGQSANSTRADPPVRPPVVIPRSISAPAPLLSNNESTPANLSLRVLLVDDNDINLNILKTCMKRALIPFDFAKDGLQAVNTFQQAYNAKVAFTHVLMDISMPVMDGIQATREIREFERTKNSLQRVSSRTAEIVETAPQSAEDLTLNSPVLESRSIIIALSGVASEVTQLEMLEAGADMFLPKPVKLKELIKMLGT